MKKFLQNITYFLFILIGINVILWVAAKKLYFENYHDYSLNYSSYIVSDSHGLPLKNFTEKYGVYNFSGGSDSYFDMKRKIVFLANKTDVKTIFITVDDHTLSKYREKTNSLDRSQFFVMPEVCSSYYEYFKLRYIRFYVAFFQPGSRSVIKYFITSKMKKLFSRNNQNNVVIKKKTWPDFTAEERHNRSKKRLERQYPSNKESYKLRQTLLDIINYCKERNIVLIGLKYPLSSDYIKVLGNKTYGADKIFKYEGLNVIDYKDVFVSQNKYFNNQDHLNETGAHKFLELLFLKQNSTTQMRNKKAKKIISQR